HPATTRHNDDVGLAGHEGSVWNETQSVGARHKRLRSTCYQTHTEGRARLASATHDLHRAERVHFVETVVDHNVNQHGARLARRTSTAALGAPHVIPRLWASDSRRQRWRWACARRGARGLSGIPTLPSENDSRGTTAWRRWRRLR